jgi:uncharacterized HAD superfamily protein
MKQSLTERLQGDVESFDSFFAGLEPQEERDAVHLYKDYFIAHTVQEVLKEVGEVIKEELPVTARNSDLENITNNQIRVNVLTKLQDIGHVKE